MKRFLDNPERRLVLAYGTGCGKTPTSIRALAAWWEETMRAGFLKNERAPRFLVVCPAIVRRHWVKEFEKWAMLEASPIEMGRYRQSGSKRALEERDASYAANIQVVSYDLMSHVDGEGWDAIVFDEIHHLSDCTSRQSIAARKLMAQNPGVAALGLSATLIPTQVWQLWHPMWLLFGNTWGRPPRAGKIAWDFVGRYCELEKNEYGTSVGALRDSRRSELRNKVLKHAHRLTREDIVADLPPIDASILDIGGTALGRDVSTRTKRPEVAPAVEWYTSLSPDITHAVILCYNRDVARAVERGLTVQLKGVAFGLVDGSMPTAERVRILDELEAAPRALLIATSESLREGIRMMWAQKVLFAQWRQSPAQVVQVLGRFYSVGDRRRPQIEILSDESLYGAAYSLVHRMGEVNSLLKAGNTERVVSEVFAPQELSEARLEELTRSMLAQHKERDADWSESAEESEDEW